MTFDSCFRYFSLLSLLLTTFVSCRNAKAGDDGCSLDVNSDLPKKGFDPLILKKTGDDYSLALPKIKGSRGLIELKEGETLTLACPGNRNYLAKSTKDTATSTCISGTQFSVGDVAINSVDAKCVKPARALIKELGKKCAPNARFYEVGFQAGSWHRMYTVCHDSFASNTLYSEHTVFGEAVRGRVREKARPEFEEGHSNLFTDVDATYLYRKASQKSVFRRIFGEKKANEYLTEQNFMSRGHLAPDADFLFGSWQFSTYFYINVVPQWQTINGGNWLKWENAVRDLAAKLNSNMKIITGSYGILELDDAVDRKHKIYLDERKKRIPVPEFVWKVVYDESNKNGIALVTSNNPFAKKVNPLCEDICKESGWSFGDIKNIPAGYSFCCQVNDLRKMIPQIPNLNVAGILYGLERN